MRESEFVFDFVDSLYYKLHKVSLNRGGSYLDSPKWVENKLKKHENVCKNHDYCHGEMPNKDNKISKYNHGEKSMKHPFIIYANVECLLEKMSTCHDNPEKSSTTKINEHTPSGYSMFTYCSFDDTKNKLDCYRGNDCMERFCKGLKELTTKTVNYEKKEMIPLLRK